jgi:hypothetical protein
MMSPWDAYVESLPDNEPEVEMLECGDAILERGIQTDAIEQAPSRYSQIGIETAMARLFARFGLRAPSTT